MQPRVLALSFVLVASAAGCGALLGVEEVALDDGAGGGGGRGTAGGGVAAGEDGGAPGDASGGPITVSGGGAGPRPGSSSATDGAGGAGGEGPSVTGGGPTSTTGSTTSGGVDPTAATSAAAGGGSCVQDRPACPGLVASRFEDDAALDAWVVEAPRIKIAGRKLQLDPEDDREAASLRSSTPAGASGSCAVWLRREDGDAGLTRLSLLGADGGERIAIAWGASGALAYADGLEVGSVSASDAAARFLRIRLEPEGAHLEIKSDDTTCWEPVAGPITVAAPDGAVRLSYAGSGKAKVDDYAVP